MVTTTVKARSLLGAMRAELRAMGFEVPDTEALADVYLDELGADSLDLLELGQRMEDSFPGLAIEKCDLAERRPLGALVEVLQRRLEGDG